jgi:ATP-binding cassette subfamily F protein 3
VDRFSGGEKARLALALLIWRRPNLLLLDEPTNHLDIDMREALTEALQEYQGALVLVSHDRHLLRTTCDEFLLVANGQVAEYDGDLDDYRQFLSTRQSNAPNNTADARPKGQSRKEERREAAKSRQSGTGRRRPIEKRSAALEKDIARLGADLQRIDGQLADTGFYGDGTSDAVRKALSERAKLAEALAAVENEWMEVLSQLEAMGPDA